MDAHSKTVTPLAGNSTLRRMFEIGVVGYALFHVVTSLFGTYEPLVQRSLFLGIGIGMIFLETALRNWPAASCS